MRRKSFGATVVVLTAITHISHKYGIQLIPCVTAAGKQSFLNIKLNFGDRTTGFATI